MRNKAYLPKIPYVVFELVKISVREQKDKSNDYQAEQIDTIYLAVMPESYAFKTHGRNSVVQTGKDVFIDQYPIAPEKVSISGTFGDMPRLIGGTFLDGYTRLKQFEERIVQMKLESYIDSEKLIQEQVNKSESILAVNYYDFLWHKFGSISVENFDVRANAAQNVNMIRYSFDFTIVGDLINVKSDLAKGDPLLTGLSTLLGPGSQKALDNTVNNVLYQMQESFMGVGLKWLGAVDALKAVSAIVADTKDMYNKYKTGIYTGVQGLKNGIF